MLKAYLYNLATDKVKGFIPAIIKVFLFLLCLIYGLIIRFLILFHRVSLVRLDCRVISVGNITLGGTGKTVLVEFITRYLKQHGHKIAILSRGYKKNTKRYTLNAIRYEDMGDEPYMLTERLSGTPVIVDKDRVRAAKKAIKDYSVDTVILDDGFQQWRIFKDLEIGAVSATNPFGNHCLIPRGILREPLSSLGRADIFILTKTNLNANVARLRNTLNKLNPKAIIVESAHNPSGLYSIDKPQELFSVDNLKGETVTLFSGIGDPDSFENLIAGSGIRIGLSFRFKDHHPYTQKDLDEIVFASKNKGVDTIVTTEKDAVRLYGLRVTGYGLRVFVLRIELKITKNEDEFCNRLLGLYKF